MPTEEELNRALDVIYRIVAFKKEMHQKHLNMWAKHGKPKRLRKSI